MGNVASDINIHTKNGKYIPVCTYNEDEENLVWDKKSLKYLGNILKKSSKIALFSADPTEDQEEEN